MSAACKLSPSTNYRYLTPTSGVVLSAAAGAPPAAMVTIAAEEAVPAFKEVDDGKGGTVVIRCRDSTACRPRRRLAQVGGDCIDHGRSVKQDAVKPLKHPVHRGQVLVV